MPRPPRGEEAMIQTAFRLPAELLAQVDRYAELVSEQTGLGVTRAEAVRVLLTAGLQASGAGLRDLKAGTPARSRPRKS